MESLKNFLQTKAQFCIVFRARSTRTLTTAQRKRKKIQNRPVAGESEAESESKEEQEAEEELVSYGSGEAGKPEGGKAEAEEVKRNNWSQDRDCIARAPRTCSRKSRAPHAVSTKIKLQRAQGGCPGTIRRRRTWQAAKSNGERQAGIDPLISEWGNPADEESVTVR